MLLCANIGSSVLACQAYRLLVREPHETVTGTVDSWSYEEGWGVLRTPDGLSVFCHFSNIPGPGYRSLQPGTAVHFDYETPGQDGCEARVRTAARPVPVDETT
jgi:CspA family cold shock protein